MARVFYNALSIIYINYLETGRTVTGAYYVALLDRLLDKIKKKLAHLHKKKNLYHDDNDHLTPLSLHRQMHEIDF